MTFMPRPRLPTTPASFQVGGVKVSAVTGRTAVDHFYALLAARQGGYVTVTSAHGVVEALTDKAFGAIVNGAVMTLPDGMPIYWAGRYIQGQTMGRLPGAEFFNLVLTDRRAGTVRHFFYGSQESTTKEVACRAAAACGDTAVAGWHCPPFRLAGTMEDDETIKQMQASAPDVIWVGLSTPKQEYFMANHAHLFPNTLFVGVGAAFDFYAGIKDRGPQALSSTGFEWLYRLVSEPKRLWPRYRVVVPVMLSILARDAVARTFGRGSAPSRRAAAESFDSPPA